MTIEYIQRIQQGGGRGSGQLDLALSQKEWSSDLTTWVIQNKMMHSGPNSLESFCQALLLHLQSFGSGNSLASTTSLLLNQTAAGGAEEDPLLRQQQQLASQATLLQQLSQQQVVSSPGKATSGSEAATNTSPTTTATTAQVWPA